MRPAPRYDGGTIALHWLNAVLVLGLWLVGTFLEDLVPEGALRSGVWSRRQNHCRAPVFRHAPHG